ncbi:hypothetical protein [Chitinophaga sp. CB10]|uniref:hypothetical protein n=1 Tax=Chitinophaga sp. CB10 TaxID=1891659 RepID=UPI0025BD0294|nr:hypothetical protein [Chitinophaga sp. CB10]
MEWNHILPFDAFRESFAHLYTAGEDLQQGYQQFVSRREMEILAAGHFHRAGEEYLRQGSVPFHHQYFRLADLAPGQLYCMIRPDDADAVLLSLAPGNTGYSVGVRYMRLLDNTFAATIPEGAGAACYQQLQRAIQQAIVPAPGLKRTAGTRYELGWRNGTTLELAVQRSPEPGSPVQRVADLVKGLIAYGETGEELLLERVHELYNIL